MKTYVGRRNPDGLCSVQVNGHPLRLRLDLSNHSPTGFEWGYGGSGPAQLALALLADVIDDDEALALHQDFKFRLVGRMPHGGFTLTEADIMRVVNELRIKRPRHR
jgi:uncharacterized protein DUF6166